jgi:uncharacterized phage protein (TIGR02216 family)
LSRPRAPAEPFPWERAIAVGLGVLRLSPASFWAMTPLEFALAAGLGRGGNRDVPDRRAMAALMAIFPD